MNSNEYCLDTNIIITYLFEIEPNHMLVKDFTKKSSNQMYYTEHINLEITHVINNKINFISTFMYDCISIINNYNEEFIDYDTFISYVLKNDKKYLYRNQKVHDNVKKEILKCFWKRNNFYNVNIFDFRNAILEYITNLKISTLNYKTNFLKKLILIPKHNERHEQIESVIIENNIHKEDMLIILDIYEYYTRNHNEIILISFDKDFVNSLNQCNFQFLKELWDVQNLKSYLQQ